MTDQEIFDIVCAHLRSMKKPSIRVSTKSDFFCVYRADDGGKCAAGILIPDEEYHPDMEGKNFVSVCNDYTYMKYKFNYDQVWLIRRLQNLHDDEKNWGVSGFLGENGLKDVSVRHHLNYTELKVVAL